MRDRPPLSRIAPATVAAIASCLIVAGCSGDGAAADPPVAPQGDVPPSVLAKASPPARTYQDACATCHDRGGFGVRVLADRLGPENALIHVRNDLAPETIRAIVRNGMGAMPAMSKGEVSDSELDGIIAFLGEARTRVRAGENLQ